MSVIFRIIIISLEEEVQEYNAKTINEYKINFSVALGKIRSNLIYLFLGKRILYNLKETLDMIFMNLTTIRKDRYYQRTKVSVNNKYAFSYKTNL
ncbi:MAG: hypothetical protein PHY08_05925 [Candidatus Cloacimonetes bacterium]|nr:hypothetical protein [Candidatus Cloacimonadota bacterium]MDD4156096.1 hypothetical protein [Candidatus Cloacimonadota bacterium]